VVLLTVGPMGGPFTSILLAPAAGGTPHEVLKAPVLSPWFHPSRSEILYATRVAPPQFSSLPINTDGSAGAPKPYASAVLMQAVTEFGPDAVKDFDAGHERVLVRVNESDMDIVKRKVIP
jgi:hypothetical protein